MHRLDTRFLPTLMLGAVWLAMAPMAQAQPADTGSRVVRVKVYPGSATVERTLRLAPGARQAIFACLPAGLDAASLQVSSDATVRVGELAVRQQARELLGNACASPLDERIRGLEDQIAALQAESAGIGDSDKVRAADVMARIRARQAAAKGATTSTPASGQ